MVVLCISMLLSLTACGGDQTEGAAAANSVQGNSDSAATEGIQTKPQTRARKCPKNVLMEVHRENEAEKSVFLTCGNFDPSWITSITFLDTLEGMPDTAWDVSEAQNGSVMAWLENETKSPDGFVVADLIIAGEGGVTANENSAGLFAGFIRAEYIDFNDCFYTDNVTSMEEMFQGCMSLKELDLSFFNTSNVSNMYRMFRDCEDLESLDLSSFDTSSVTTVEQMFFQCERLTSVNLSGWDVSNVTDFSDMFMNCERLVSLDLSGFHTASARCFRTMFDNCKALEELDVSSFDTYNVNDFQAMFSGCESLTKLDLSSFTFESAADFQSMFRNCVNLTDIGCEFDIPPRCITDDMYLNSGLE